MQRISIDCLTEPDLLFQGGKEDKDPKLGLKNIGPFSFFDEPKNVTKVVNVGIVGTGVMIYKTRRFIKALGEEVKSNNDHPWLYQDYPGMNARTKFNSILYNGNVWVENIRSDEEKTVFNEANVNKRIAKGVSLYIEKIKQVLNPDPKPDVIICCLSREFDTYCGISESTKGRNRPRLTEREKFILRLTEDGAQTSFDDFPNFREYTDKDDKETHSIITDFRDALKGKAMEYGKPIQLLREVSLDKFLNAYNSSKADGDDPSNFAWNFSTALYYKASGKPWRLAKLRDDTCYVGISFYKTKYSLKGETESSMAQVFTESGEGLVIRGNDVRIDKKTREAHMTQSQSERLLQDAIGIYTNTKGHPPGRVVVHKTSGFSGYELEGFQLAIGAKMSDFVAITKERYVRLLRERKYPVMRGTVLYTGKSEALLYTVGFITRLRTYDGPMIPTPLHIEHTGDSSLQEICYEILGLSKLDWNTTAFSVEYPITLQFSRNVGRVLAQLPAGKPIQNEYRFYM